MASLAEVYGGGDIGVNVNMTQKAKNPLSNPIVKYQGQEIAGKHPAEAFDNGGGGGVGNGNLQQLANNGGSSSENKSAEDAEKVIATLSKKLEQKKKLEKIKEELTNSEKKNKSIVERYGSKFQDVVKLFTLGLVVMLALSMHDIVKYYVSTKYINTNDLTPKQEIYVRLSVPVAVFMVIWTLKTFGA